MELKGSKYEKAKQYSDNWEEITGLDYENSVPSEINRLDFINGYNQALQDNKDDELREQRNDLLEALKGVLYDNYNHAEKMIELENLYKRLESKT